MNGTRKLTADEALRRVLVIQRVKRAQAAKRPPIPLIRFIDEMETPSYERKTHHG